MRKSLFLFWILLGLGCGSTKGTLTQSSAGDILVFTKTNGWRHESIPAGKIMMEELAGQFGRKIHFTEDSLDFNDANLDHFELVVFLNTTGDILGKAQERAFQNYIETGGSFLGIHSAADTECDWPWYLNLVGACFESHPNNPNVLEARVHCTENKHRSTAHLPEVWTRKDEWYNYHSMNEAVTPLLVLDENSYKGGTHGDYHPIAWYHKVGKGNAFYTGGGHTAESYQEPLFRKHIAGAMQFIFEPNN